MLEALVFYQMREENLQKHTPAQWTLLSQSFQVLKPEEKLADFFYIDDAMTVEELKEIEEENLHLTLDSPDRVNSRLALARYMIDHLKSEIPQWQLVLRPTKVIYLDLPSI